VSAKTTIAIFVIIFNF